ncbi:MAG: hypothetical protein ABJN20_02840, partial [Lentilitoribacter sp.]
CRRSLMIYPSCVAWWAGGRVRRCSLENPAERGQAKRTLYAKLKTMQALAKQSRDVSKAARQGKARQGMQGKTKL